MGRKKSRGKSAATVRAKVSKSDHIEKKNDTDNLEEFWKKQSRETGSPTIDAIDAIDVVSRLTYAYVGVGNASISSDESDGEEDTIELDVRPRFVFVSSLCAVCLNKSRVICKRCQMVSYCSITHQTRGSLEHRDLCDALLEIRWSFARSLGDGTTTEQTTNERLDAERYRVYRVRLLGMFESKVGRPLNLWEKEIVLYPRICRICRCFREDPICCARCGMECFCEVHAEEHEKWCTEFQVLQRCLFLQHRHGCATPRIPNVRREMLVASPDVDFDRLMRRVYQDSSYYREMDAYTYSVLSHLCTIPLTTLYSMQICCPEWRSKTDYTVHIVGAEFQFEGINLRAWEKLFLHFLPNLKRLCLVLIGPELQLPSGVPENLLSKVKLCSDCKSADRKIAVHFRPRKLYHEFAREESKLVADADLICLFNPGLYRKTGFAGEDTWLETIREFSKLPAPVAVTSYTADEIHWEMARINSVTDAKLVLEPRRNPFASVKPDRNFVSDDTNPLIYKNYYVTVVARAIDARPRT